MERVTTMFKEVLGRFCTGITVITSLDGGTPVGFACQSFSSLSLDPPLVLFCVAQTSESWPRIQRSGRFAVNVLAEDQREVCGTFATSGGDKFAGLSWVRSRNGTAHLTGVLAVVDCTISEVHRVGDHFIVVGSVNALHKGRDGQPLLFYRGAFAQGAFARV